MASRPQAKVFGSEYPTVEEVTRNKLMDAGIACISRYGFKKTNVRLIAEESGIARQTVYNYFKNKDALLAEAFTREGIKLGLMAAEHIQQFDCAEDQFVEGFLFIYEEFPKNPILAKVIELGSDFFKTVGLAAYPYSTFGELVFEKLFEEHAYLKPHSDSISELWIRGVMSFLTMPGPSPRSRDELEDFVRLRLLPGIGLKN